MKAKEIIEQIKTSKDHMFIKRNQFGHRLLTLSWRPNKGFRYFPGTRSGGGGRKHTLITEQEALKLVEKVIE